MILYTALDCTYTEQCSITTIFSTVNLYRYSTTQPTKNKKHHTSNKNPPVHISFTNISITIRGIGPRSSRLQAKNPLSKHGYSRTLTAPHLPYENIVRPTPVTKYRYLANIYFDPCLNLQQLPKSHKNQPSSSITNL